MERNGSRSSETDSSALNRDECIRNGTDEIAHTADVYAFSLLYNGGELTAERVEGWIETKLFTPREAEAIVKRYEELSEMYGSDNLRS